MKCQRCLERMILPLDVRFRLGLVRDKDALNDLSDWYEPLVVTAEPADIADILSDEVLLALPIVPLLFLTRFYRARNPMSSMSPVF